MGCSSSNFKLNEDKNNRDINIREEKHEHTLPVDGTDIVQKQEMIANHNNEIVSKNISQEGENENKEDNS